MPFLFATVIGIPIVSAGLWRAAILPLWPFAVGLIGAAGFFLPISDLLPTALIAAVLVWTAIGLLRSGAEAGPTATSPTRLQPAPPV